jgi:hypothetical protein
MGIRAQKRRKKAMNNKNYDYKKDPRYKIVNELAVKYNIEIPLLVWARMSLRELHKILEEAKKEEVSE